MPSARMPSSQSLLYSSLHPHWHPLHQSLCTHWRPAIQRTIGWSVRKAPFAGQGACGKEGTKWKMAMRTRREQQGARCSLTHGARGARGKMHASRCAHRGVRARKKLAQTTQSGNKVGNPLWIPFSVLRKKVVPCSISDFRSDGFRRVSRFDSRFQL